MPDTISKTTVGFVTQTFDTKTGKCIEQEFVAGDQVEWEDEDGQLIDPDEVTIEEIDYFPFNMVQPKE